MNLGLKFRKDPCFRWGDIQLLVTMYISNYTLNFSQFSPENFDFFGTPSYWYFLISSFPWQFLTRRKKPHAISINTERVRVRTFWWHWSNRDVRPGEFQAYVFRCFALFCVLCFVVFCCACVLMCFVPCCILWFVTFCCVIELYCVLSFLLCSVFLFMCLFCCVFELCFLFFVNCVFVICVFCVFCYVFCCVLCFVVFCSSLCFLFFVSSVLMRFLLCVVLCFLSNSSVRPRSWLCFPPVTTRNNNNPHQNLPDKSVLQTCNLAPRLNPNHTGKNRLYRPYFCILNIKNRIKGLLGHKSCPQQGPWPVMVLHWALQGPLKGPCDFQDFARLCLPFLKKIHSLNPLNIMEHVYGHCWTSPRFRESSWTFMDPHFLFYMNSQTEPLLQQNFWIQCSI